MKLLDSSRVRFGVAVLGFFTLLAGDAWRYSITWYGFGVIVLAVSAYSIGLLVRQRDKWSVGRLPYPLLAFLVLMTVSLAWSFYPSGTAVGLVATWLTIVSGVAYAITFSWAEILRILGVALRLILSLSLVFELVVSIFVRQPLLPFWYSYPDGKLAMSLYWSRNLLFANDKIQGITGNSVLLGFVALLGLIVFGIQYFSLAKETTTRLVRLRGLLWIALAAAMIALTRSATIIIAVVVIAAVLGAVLVIRTTRRRVLAYGVFGLVGVAAVLAFTVFRDVVFGLLGKSSTLTGRGTIWTDVIALAQERPVFGWGWVSYWVPWAAPFDTLAFEGGVHQYQAHNAWIDVWFQLGFVGLAVFIALVLSTVVRSWFMATDRPRSSARTAGEYTALSLLPLLVMVALLVQSTTESRMLVEYGLALLTITAVKTRLGERGNLP
jgi:exopolysaccharide production protein ExoQ